MLLSGKIFVQSVSFVQFQTTLNHFYQLLVVQRAVEGDIGVVNRRRNANKTTVGIAHKVCVTGKHDSNK